MVTGAANRPQTHQRQPQRDGGGGIKSALCFRGKTPRGGRSSSDAQAFSGCNSASTSCGSAGSPSSHIEPVVTPPASENTFTRPNHLDIQGDEDGNADAAMRPYGLHYEPTAVYCICSLCGSYQNNACSFSGKKKKRGARAVVSDKSGRGLRQFSMKVCEKVKSKGRTTYNEVADELVQEFADPINNTGSQDKQQYDEKNIRRRVYDALNVLMAMDIISKDKKEIQWKGLPRTSFNDIEELKTERLALKNRIEKRTSYLQELQDQLRDLQNLIQRNEQSYGSHSAPGGVALPFILVQTRPHATVEVEISEDMQLVHFDFNSTPFELHDDSYVLKAMRLCQNEENEVQELSSNGGDCSSTSTMGMYQHNVSQTMWPSTSKTTTSPPPKPGILKTRVKNEHVFL